MPHTRASRWRLRTAERVALGRAVQELREGAVVSQFVLAYDSGAGRPYVNARSSARVKPTFERLRDLLDTLGYGFSDLAEAYDY